jgi:hypothetical protein
MSYEDHPKSNWVVGYSGLSPHFLVVGIPFIMKQCWVACHCLYFHCRIIIILKCEHDITLENRSFDGSLVGNSKGSCQSLPSFEIKRFSFDVLHLFAFPLAFDIKNLNNIFFSNQGVGLA